LKREPNGQGFKIPLLLVVGPTAVGKTALSIELAKKLGGEIISADSVQVYRYLDIGSAKPGLEERQGIPHHLIDIVDPDVNFTVYDYQDMARRCIKDIYSRGKLPILAGGTGLYINATIDEYTFCSGKSGALVRKRLQEEMHSKGKEYLYNRLQLLDPKAAGRVHPNDWKRIIRALEFYYLTGKPISVQWEMTKKKKSAYNVFMVGLILQRNHLYERINRRVDSMIEKGLLDEVKLLLEKGYHKGLKSLQSLGYRHVMAYLEGQWEWEEAISFFKRDTRRYAKRQLTWFRADERTNWYELTEGGEWEPICNAICRKAEGYFTSFTE